MKCNDAVEGSAKIIVRRLHDLYVQQKLEDSEYVRNVRTIINATEEFVSENSDIFTSPRIVKQVLYDYAKHVWITHAKASTKQGNDLDDPENSLEDTRYFEYFYDYIYQHDEYPR